MRAGADEGSAGTGAAYGGAVTIPFSARWAADVQVLASNSGNVSDFRANRLLFSPAVQYRRGTERCYWFVAAGLGVQRDRNRGTFLSVGPTVASEMVGFDQSSTGGTLHWRTGLVLQANRRVLVRGEFFSSNRYVLPSIGVAVSVGIRLGR
jgi:hypothetical protein